jgi:hypothetical protein
MLYIRLFRDLQKNILPDNGKILRLGNHCHLPHFAGYFRQLHSDLFPGPLKDIGVDWKFFSHFSSLQLAYLQLYCYSKLDYFQQ